MNWWRRLKFWMGFRPLYSFYYMKPTPEKPKGERILVIGNEVLRRSEE